jgi:hypothetical protein
MLRGAGLTLVFLSLSCSSPGEVLDAGGGDGAPDVAEGGGADVVTPPDAQPDAGPGGSYATTFPLTENPISESGRWIGGLTTGLDWHDARTTPGFAFGTQDGTTTYDDSIAVLSGTWGPTQTAQATARVVNANDGGEFEEIEVLLRFSITAHDAHGYEINCSIKPSGIGGGPYMQIVKWLGARNAWIELDGRSVGCADGDVLMATITGSGNGNVTITAYKNGAAQFSATDNKTGGVDAYDTGAPGMGFYLQQGVTADDADFGFSSYSASGS